MADLTTLAAAKLYAGVQGSADDALIGGLVTAYSAWFEKETNRSFALASHDQWFSGRAATSMKLPEWPVADVTLLTINGITIPQQVSIGSFGYRFDDEYVTLDGAEFMRGQRNVQIEWSAGYAPIPTDIRQAINELVGLRYATHDKQGWSSKSLAGETVSLTTKAMPDSVKAVVENYRAVIWS